MRALIYTKRMCPFCDRAKELMNQKGIAYTESVVGEDMLREEFVEMFPSQKTVPLIFIDGERVGGYDDLVERVSNSKQFLSE